MPARMICCDGRRHEPTPKAPQLPPSVLPGRNSVVAVRLGGDNRSVRSWPLQDVRPKVVFTKGEGGSYWCHVHRPDGVVVFVPGYDRKFRVPHDLAHVATERALRMTDGVFGSVMGGALFENMRVVSGRRHNDRQRSDRIVRANATSKALGVAEVLAGVMQEAVERGDRRDLLGRAREQWGILRAEPFPYSAADLAAACDLLEDLATQWAALPIEGQLDVPW